MKHTSPKFGATTRSWLSRRTKNAVKLLSAISSAYNLPFVGTTIAAGAFLTGGFVFGMEAVGSSMTIGSALKAGLGMAGVGAIGGIIPHIPSILQKSADLAAGEPLHEHRPRKNKNHRHIPSSDIRI